MSPKIKHGASGHESLREDPAGVKQATSLDRRGDQGFYHGERGGRVPLKNFAASYGALGGFRHNAGHGPQEASLKRVAAVLAATDSADRDPRIMYAEIKTRMIAGDMSRKEASTRVSNIRRIEFEQRVDAVLAVRDMNHKDARMSLAKTLKARDEKLRTPKELTPEIAMKGEERGADVWLSELKGKAGAQMDQLFDRYRGHVAAQSRKSDDQLRHEAERVWLDQTAKTHGGPLASKYEKQFKAHMDQELFGMAESEIPLNAEKELREAFDAQFVKENCLRRTDARYTKILSGLEEKNALLPVAPTDAEMRKSFDDAIKEAGRTFDPKDPSTISRAQSSMRGIIAAGISDQEYVQDVGNFIRGYVGGGPVPPMKAFQAQETESQRKNSGESIVRQEIGEAAVLHRDAVLGSKEGKALAEQIHSYMAPGPGEQVDEASLDPKGGQVMLGQMLTPDGQKDGSLALQDQDRLRRKDYRDTLTEGGFIDADEAILRLRNATGKPMTKDQEQDIRRAIDEVNLSIEMGELKTLQEHRAEVLLRKEPSESIELGAAAKEGIADKFKSAQDAGAKVQALANLDFQDTDAVRKELGDDFLRKGAMKARQTVSDIHDMWNSPGMTVWRQGAGTGASAVSGSYKVAEHFARAFWQLMEQVAMSAHQISEASREAGKGDIGSAVQHGVSGSVGLVKAPFSAASDVVGGAGLAKDGMRDARDARHRTTDAKRRSLSVAQDRLRMAKEDKAQEVDNAQEMIRMTNEYTGAVADAFKQASVASGAGSEMERADAMRQLELARKHIESSLTQIEQEHPAMADVIKHHPMLSPEAVNTQLGRIRASESHHNEQVRVAMSHCGLTETGTHGEFSSVIDLGEWNNHGAIESLKTQARGGGVGPEGAALDQARAAQAERPDGAPERSTAQPRLAMTLRDGNATFNLVGCEDWSDPRRSEGAQLASVRIRDLGEVARRMDGCHERREQLVVLAAWSKEMNEKLQNAKIPMDDPRRQDWAATLSSIQGVQRMVEHAGPNGLDQHRLKALGYVQEMEVQMNGSFPSLKLGNPAHREMVRHFNEHLRQGQGVAAAGGWTIDPTVMANYYSNRIHEGANILSGGMNTPQKLKAYMRWFSRCEAERDSMEDALVMLQIEAERQGMAA